MSVRWMDDDDEFGDEDEDFEFSREIHARMGL